MLQALSLYRYAWVLIGTENVYHANTRRHRQEGGSSPTDSRGAPHRFKRWPPHVCGAALCSMWNLVPFRIRRTLARSWYTFSSSQHQAYSAGCRHDYAINKSNSAGDMSTGDIGVQEYQISGSSIIIMLSPRKSEYHEYAM